MDRSAISDLNIGNLKDRSPILSRLEKTRVRSFERAQNQKSGSSRSGSMVKFYPFVVCCLWASRLPGIGVKKSGDSIVVILELRQFLR